jgi:hypothetical protein
MAEDQRLLAPRAELELAVESLGEGADAALASTGVLA